MKKIDTLKQHINAGEVQQALVVIKSDATPEDFGQTYGLCTEQKIQFAKEITMTVLSENTSTEEMLNEALEKFVKTTIDRKICYGHVGWVHDLSHFMSWVYKRGLKSWIKRLNEIAFVGAIECGNSHCCERLVEDFARSAPWDAVPAEYGFTDENLRWTSGAKDYLREWLDKDLKFIQQFPFESPDKCRKPHYKHEQGA